MAIRGLKPVDRIGLAGPDLGLRLHLRTPDVALASAPRPSRPARFEAQPRIRSSHMATATSRPSKRPEPPAQPKKGRRAVRNFWSGLLHLFEVIFRFLASLKLAVICLGTLSATLAVGHQVQQRLRPERRQRIHLPDQGVRPPDGVPRDQRPLRGLDPLPLGQAADRLPDHPPRPARGGRRVLLVGFADVGRRPTWG